MRFTSTRLTDRLKQTLELLKVESTWYGTLPGVFSANNVDVGMQLRCGVAILTVAHFEEFLRDLFEAAIDDLNSRNPQVRWKNLPQRLRHAHTFDGVPPNRSERYPAETDEAFEVRMMAKMSDLAQAISSPLGPAPYTILVAPFTDTNSNPNSERISSLTKQLGIQKLYESPLLQTCANGVDGPTTDPSLLRKVIDRIVMRRHYAAHGRSAAMQSVSRSDLENSINFLCGFGPALEKLVEQHMNSLT